MISEPVAAFLQQHGTLYEAIACDPDYSDTAEFCEKYGYQPEESANVIVIGSTKGEPKFAACVVLAHCRLDVNKTARKKLGVRRISFANPDVTREMTGMELGGVTAFGMPDQIPLWIADQVMDCERIVLGGGNRSSKILMPPAELAKVPNSEVVPGLAMIAGAGKPDAG